MSDSHLLEAALELAQAADKMADENLPQKIADIVKLHAKLAVASAFIPIPGADMAAGAANIWTMYVRINSALELPFSDNMLKSVASGVLTNIGAAAAGMLVVGSALKLIPGLGTLGGAAIMGATIYGVTIAAGWVYMNALAGLLRRKSADTIKEADLKAATAAEMRDSEKLKDVIKSGRDAYKKGL